MAVGSRQAGIKKKDFLPDFRKTSRASGYMNVLESAVFWDRLPTT